MALGFLNECGKRYAAKSMRACNSCIQSPFKIVISFGSSFLVCNFLDP
jgi:hypothetical protein